MNFWNPFIRIASRVASRGKKPIPYSPSNVSPFLGVRPINDRSLSIAKSMEMKAALAKRKDKLDVMAWGISKKEAAERKILPLRSSIHPSDKTFTGEYHNVYKRKIGPFKIKKESFNDPAAWAPTQIKPSRPITRVLPRDNIGRRLVAERITPGGGFDQWSIGVGKYGLKGDTFSQRRKVAREIKKHKVATAVGVKTAAVAAAAAAASQRKKPTTRIGTAYRPRRIPKNPKKGRR